MGGGGAEEAEAAPFFVDAGGAEGGRPARVCEATDAWAVSFPWERDGQGSQAHSWMFIPRGDCSYPWSPHLVQLIR